MNLYHTKKEHRIMHESSEDGLNFLKDYSSYGCYWYLKINKKIILCLILGEIAKHI